MTQQEETAFVAGAFQALKARGWFPGQALEPSAMTGQAIAAFEEAHRVRLPSLYKTFLTSFRLPRNTDLSMCHCRPRR